MPTDPKLVPRDALAGLRVAISVSDSADLARLGLDPGHLRTAVAELTRAIVVAGGSVIYGGRVNRDFTDLIEEEAERFGRGPVNFEHFIPASEYAGLPSGGVEAYLASLSVRSRAVLLDPEGIEIAPEAADGQSELDETDVAASLSVMRRVVSEHCDARVLIGGRLSNFKGEIPGVVEEACEAVRAGKPIFVAGGFGGASALVVREIDPADLAWAPADLPTVSDQVASDVRVRLESVGPPMSNGLSDRERKLLAESYRASEVAALTVLGLARLKSDNGVVASPQVVEGLE